ncbi:hypothetical protein Tco_0776879 [Tanacetum coccineum]
MQNKISSQLDGLKKIDTYTWTRKIFTMEITFSTQRRRGMRLWIAIDKATTGVNSIERTRCKDHICLGHKGKEITKLVTPQSESVSEEDSDPEQAQRDKDMQKNLALLAKYFKRLYKPTNNNLSNFPHKLPETRLNDTNTLEGQSWLKGLGVITRKKVMMCKQVNKFHGKDLGGLTCRICSIDQPLEQVLETDDSNVTPVFINIYVLMHNQMIKMHQNVLMMRCCAWLI